MRPPSITDLPETLCLQPLRARELYAGDHVGRPCAAGDERWPMIDHRVEDPPRLVVCGVGGSEHAATKVRPEVLKR
jgi:hypothetical protein